MTSEAALEIQMDRLRAYATYPEQQFGRNLRAVREKRGLTQQAVAELMTFYGLPMMQTTVAKLEAGLRPLRLNEVVVLCAAYGFPELMAGVFGPIAFGDQTMHLVRKLMEGEAELFNELRRTERTLRQQLRKYLSDRLAELGPEEG